MTPRPRIAGLAGLLLLGGCGQSNTAAPPEPSTLVTVEMPRQGSRPLQIMAYGSIGPARDGGSDTVSMAQPGQVTDLMVTPGAPVRRGQPLLRFTLSPTALGAYQQAATALEAARTQRATTARLFGQQLATRDQVAASDKAVSDAQTALAALRKEGAGAAEQIVRAPYDGIVTTIAATQGDRTAAGQALLTIASGRKLVATVGVPSADVARMKAGQSADVTPLAGGGTLAATVTRVGATLNPRTRLIDVDLGVAPGVAVNGEAVRAAIRTGAASGWVVPHRAVVTASGQPHLLQVVNGKAAAVPVSILSTGSDADVVAGPVHRHRPIIIDGAYQVGAGGAVRWVRDR
ncbi:efflux RND transporter periplasmic adaptor subunit [Sphingomonas naphthae]|uniref:Efflux RND transporter periplasmic adaptor subunit n=1 Tax=Sphingomonas naphthae TaxID=1813468 RepID=A0ABY7TGL8_9SPHN|nr:efflux RND transporter periplasmic adaptor subunit [Sphingomonas naphthae]WCT72208.1 efflux RND transporter periplasmic adaptor subunit [Sphingomonas naphthae]